MITCKKLKALKLEEAKSSKEYFKLGFKSQARDEARHSKFFANQLIKCRRRK